MPASMEATDSKMFTDESVRKEVSTQDSLATTNFTEQLPDELGDHSRPPPMVTSSSAPTLSKTRKVKKLPIRSPLRVAPPWEKPITDKYGFPKTKPNILRDSDGVPMTDSSWDERHGLLGMPNDLVPQGIRTYFAKPQSMAELKIDLATNTERKIGSSILERIEQGDLPHVTQLPISCDPGAPMCPERYLFGGTMLDRDGMNRTWNDRWHTGIAMLNDKCHPDHRSYFTQRSLFEKSPSQQYRRFLHQEQRPGEWKPIDQRRPTRFPPMGGLLRGRSGTPIPGATT